MVILIWIESRIVQSVCNLILYYKSSRNPPHKAPEFSLDSFFNVHLTDKTKEVILAELQAEAEENLGMSMIYTLIEFAKEHQSEWVKGQFISYI